MSDDRELRLALEHPRGTEQRRLGPFRAALNDPARYAALPLADRDAIVAWAVLRETMAARGGDNDSTNLADPLIPAARLGAFVLKGEQIVASRVASSVAGSIISGPASRDAGSPATDALANAVARLRGGGRSPRR